MGRTDGDWGFAAGSQLAVGRAGHREAGVAQRAGEPAFEVAEALPWPSAQERGLDARREIAVRGAGLAQTLEGVSRAAKTVADPGVAFAVAVAGGALGIERPADGVPFADHGNELPTRARSPPSPSTRCLPVSGGYWAILGGCGM